MGVNWDDGLIPWRRYVGPDGQQFSLDHLHPLQIECPLLGAGGVPARVITIHVGFGLHTFSEERRTHHAPKTAVKDNREVRTFCPIRYRESLRLPGIVRALPGRTCQFAKHENYVSVSVDAVVYGVFFNVMRRRHERRNEMMLFVQSAYPLDAGKEQPGQGKLSFEKLVELTMQGVKPKPPQKR